MDLLKTIFDEQLKEWYGLDFIEIDPNISFGEMLLNDLRNNGDKIIQVK